MAKRASAMYSGAGDDGYTALIGGRRVPKYAPQPEAYGALDEAQAALGLARASGCHPRTAAALRVVQGHLVQAMADLARGPGAAPAEPHLGPEPLEPETPPMRGFVLPGGSLAGAFLHQARAVVRRAERQAVRMAHQGFDLPPNILPFLNRLSSYLFVLAQWEDARASSAPPPPQEA